MKKKINASVIYVLIMSIAFITCNQETKIDEAAKTDTGLAKTETMTVPAYDPAMDPLKVEAAFVKLLADTLNVKFYEATFKPGDSVGLHTHPDHLIYVIDGGTLEIYPKDVAAQVLELKAGMGLIISSQSHSGRNNGKTTVKLLVADIYRPRG